MTRFRWLLQDIATSATTAIGASKHGAGGSTHEAEGGAADLMASVADAASRMASTAGDVAAQVASDVNSEFAASMISRARAAETLDSSTALPANSAQDALDSHVAHKEHLQPPHSVWHGSARILLILVAVHLAAFLYWLVLYIRGRKFEKGKSEHTRRAIKNFKVVYDWGSSAALELATVLRKKQLSPSSSPRVQTAAASPTQAPAVARSPAGFSLNQGLSHLLKAPAP